MAEIEEKVFDPFLELCTKVRMVVINEMDAIDRCRFTRCSKSCNKEAKSSKNFVYGINVYFSLNNVMGIEVLFEGPNHIWGYALTFSKISGKKYKICGSRMSEEYWRDELDTSTSMFNYAIDYFKTLLLSYQSSLKSLYIAGCRDAQNLFSSVQCFENLENVAITWSSDVPQLFSKLRKPLKQLSVRNGAKNVALENVEGMYQVTGHLFWRQAQLDRQQLLKISAQHLVIPIGGLTERDVFQLIRAWQNGTIKHDIECYELDMTNSDFNNRKLLRLLRVTDSNAEIVKIKHFEIGGKIATLRFNGESLKFEARSV